MEETATSISKNLLEKVLYVVHRLIEFIGGWIFLFFAYITEPEVNIPEVHADDVIMHSAGTLAKLIRLRKIKVEAVINAYIDRIKKIQPALNCMVEDRFEEALQDARKCDSLLSSPNALSNDVLEREKPFFGVPFTTKDCLGITGMKQTSGLVKRKNTRATSDANSIALLREAGAIPLATTNISELAMWWESSNYLYGTTKNPYNTWHTVGGSSGGEGCIQAAAGAAMGIGADIGGSIRMPCFFNGIFGHKASTGIVSTHGHHPSTQTEEHEKLLAIGPMCRYATDLIPILKVIAGKNAAKLKLDTKVDISKLKFYYMEDDGGQMGVSPVTNDIKKSLHNAVEYLEKRHNVKAKKINIKKFKNSLPLWIANMTSPEGKDYAYQLANEQGRINIFWEFFKWIIRIGDHTLIGLFTACLQAFGIQHSSPERKKIIQDSEKFQNEIAEILGDDGVFLFPTHPTPAPLHNEPLIKPFNFNYTAIINVLGIPATACPLGFSNGLPIGIQIIAGLYQDRLTLAVAEELERGFGGWKVPPGK